MPNLRDRDPYSDRRPSMTFDVAVAADHAHDRAIKGWPDVMGAYAYSAKPIRGRRPKGRTR